MFERIGRDVDAEHAAGKLYRCPRRFRCPETGAEVEWFFDQTVKGTLTLLLTDLLDKRKAVRTRQKDVKYGTIAYWCFEGQQLACKLLANSTYGATGATEGRLAFMVVGATVTGEGKETILRIYSEVTRRYPDGEYGTRCMGGDSVAGSTPLLLRRGRDGATLIVRADELHALVRELCPDACWQPYGGAVDGDASGDCGDSDGDGDGGASSDDGKEQLDLVAAGGDDARLDVWADGGFTRVRRVIRHRTAKPLWRVQTALGCVDVTPDHSLLDAARTCVRPRDVEVGHTQLLHAYPDFTGTRANPLFAATLYRRADDAGRAERDCDDASSSDEDATLGGPSTASVRLRRTSIVAAAGDAPATCVSAHPSALRRLVPRAKPGAATLGVPSAPGCWQGADAAPTSADEAYVWGAFMAGGEIGASGHWRIVSRNRAVLELAQNVLARPDNALNVAITTRVLKQASSSAAMLGMHGGGAGSTQRGGGDNATYVLVAVSSAGAGAELRLLVAGYRDLFGATPQRRRVPQALLNAARPVRAAFVTGFADASVGVLTHFTEGNECLYTLRTHIGAAGFFFLLRSLDHAVGITGGVVGGNSARGVDAVDGGESDDDETTTLLAVEMPRGAARTVPGTAGMGVAVAALRKLRACQGAASSYVYDLETETHHFAAGVGALVVHNTDSVFLRLGHLGTAADVGRWISEVENFCNTLVERPMAIEFEKAFDGSLALAKKNYAFNNIGFDPKKTYWSWFDDEDEAMCAAVNAHAVAQGRPPPFDIAAERAKKWKRLRMDPVGTLKSKGMATVRRDSCEFVRDTLERVLELLVAQRSPARAVAWVRAQAQRLLDGRVAAHKLVMSKHYSKLEYASQSLPHLTILRKCEQRGLPLPELGSRIAFFIVRGHARSKAYERAETVEYVLEHALPLDYDYYLENQLVKPVLRILDWVYGFEVRAAPKKRYGIKAAMAPLLLATDSSFGDAAQRRAPSTTQPTSLRAFFGKLDGGAGQQRGPEPRYVHVLHCSGPGGGASAGTGDESATPLAVLIAAAGALDLVYAGALEQRPGQHYFRAPAARATTTTTTTTTTTAAAQEPAVPALLLELAGVTHVATQRVQREDGCEYVSVARRLCFDGLRRPRAPPAQDGGGGGGGGIMGFVRRQRACAAPGCLQQTFGVLCDACLAAPAQAAAAAALEAATAAARTAYEETLPVCRRCSGNYDQATKIACANSDCGHYYPRRIAEHALGRAQARADEGARELEVGVEGRARFRNLDW